MATLKINPRVETDQATLPWMILGKDHEAEDTAWRREIERETEEGWIGTVDGPDGVYWDTDYKGDFNKHVFVIEGDEPIPPPTEPPYRLFIGLPPQNEYSDIKLNVVMAFREPSKEFSFGRIHKWDLYSGQDAMVIGETDHFFIMRQDLPDLKWFSWYNPSSGVNAGNYAQVLDKYDINIKNIASGPGYKKFNDGMSVVAWRLVHRGNPQDNTTPWQPIEYSNTLLTGPILTSDPQFRYRPEFGSPHPSSFSGERYWKLPKNGLLKAIRVNVEDYDYPTVNLDPTHEVQLTWQPSTVVNSKGADATPFVEGDLHLYTGGYTSALGKTNHHVPTVEDWMNPTKVGTYAKVRGLNLKDLEEVSRSIFRYAPRNVNSDIGGILIKGLPNLPLSRSNSPSVRYRKTVVDAVKIRYNLRSSGAGSQTMVLEWSKPYANRLKNNAEFYNDWQKRHPASTKTASVTDLTGIEIIGDEMFIPNYLLQKYPVIPSSLSYLKHSILLRGHINRIDLYVGEKIVMSY